MNVKEIVIKYLKDNGYEGLCTTDCGCEIEDLIPCNECFNGCCPGYRIEYEGDWIIRQDSEVKNMNEQDMEDGNVFTHGHENEWQTGRREVYDR